MNAIRSEREQRRLDTLLGHCIARAVLATENDAPGLWAALRATPRASRVCAFVVLWAVALDHLGRDTEPSHAAIQRELNDSRATFYRRLADFRELFPEHDDPTSIALAVLDRVADVGQLSAANAQTVEVYA